MPFHQIKGLCAGYALVQHMWQTDQNVELEYATNEVTLSFHAI